MTTPTLHHANILPKGAIVDLARAELGRTRPRHLHGHDFFELLWVQNGTVRHHTTTRREDIGEGTLVLIRPGDVHGLQGREEDTLVVSVTLAPAFLDDLVQRHPSLKGILFWHDGVDPLLRQRDSRQMADLNRAANILELSGRDALAAEAFLLPVLSDLATAEKVAREAAPAWLGAACAAAREPNVFREGAAGIARLSGRAHPHVSRTMRKFYGQSPSEFINAQRMAYAARRLAGTPDTIAEIATDCGIPNLSHFHKLFRAAHGQTPLQYRKAHQHDVLQP